MNSTLDNESRRLSARIAACRFDAFESQAVFTAMLDTIARPGSIESLPSEVVARVPGVLAPVLVLADVETAVHVVETPVFAWELAVTSSTGARSTRVEDADLLAVPVEAAEQITSILHLARPGTAFAPESAARVVIGVRDLRSHGAGSVAGVELVLRGPGIDGVRSVCIDGITETDVDAWKRNHTCFPAGADTWFTTEDGRILGIPRSTHVDIIATWPTQEMI